MESLILIRHGTYGRDDRLNENGRTQMACIAEKLKPFAADKRVLVLSSTADRAAEGAEIIADTLGAPMEKHEILWSENCHPKDFPGLLKMIRNRQGEADCFIMVTHLEYAEDFPRFFGREEWGVEIPFLSVSKGEGIVLHHSQKTHERIGHNS